MYWPAKLQQGENELRKVSKLRLKWPEVKIGMAFKKIQSKQGLLIRNFSKSCDYEKYFGKKEIVVLAAVLCIFNQESGRINVLPLSRIFISRAKL